MWIVIKEETRLDITIRADDVRMVKRPRYGQCYIILFSGEVIDVNHDEADRISSLLLNGQETKDQEPVEVEA